jgi:ABC-type transporter Mla subunit MlaD
MDERKKQFRVGVVVFATGIITVVLILMSSDFSWSPFRDQYQLQVLVDQAPGVAPERMRPCRSW